VHTIGYTRRICADGEKIASLLALSRVGVLGLSDRGDPYAVPVYFVWHEGAVYFHGMGSGRKLEVLGENPSVCFTVYRDDGTVSDPVPCHADASYMSVMIFGKAERVTDFAIAAGALQAFVSKYAPGFYRQRISRDLAERYRSSMDGNGVSVFRVVPIEMTAKENAAPADPQFKSETR
jgi:nitroimidazol reductase NimA-like FMN-containing flavoprotein (pyridoxamine 5'-phosphate oxidase superfamily)